MREQTVTVGTWARTARLLAAILLVGGLAAGPVIHANEPGPVPGHEHGHPTPDPHHDCPICITLASALVTPVVASPAPLTTRSTTPAATPTTATVPSAIDLDRARAPPIT